ncbi:MAG: RidA family protein [Alphaproteobacteria bacterium]|nr:RidA family protein [Alphaproteobacteria bacterium]
MNDRIAKPLARYAAWKRRGDFVFLSGVIAVDPDRGKVITSYDDIPAEAQRLIGRSGEMSIDAKNGPILVQSWYVFDRIRATIEDAGGAMSDVFKLVQYFRSLRDYPEFARVRRLFFPDDPPVSTIVEVSGMLPSPEVIVEVEATAYLGR